MGVKSPKLFCENLFFLLILHLLVVCSGRIPFKDDYNDAKIETDRSGAVDEAGTDGGGED